MNYSIDALNETTLTIKFGDELDDSVTEVILGLFNKLKRQAEWIDVVPAYTTISVCFDWQRIRNNSATPADSLKKTVEEFLNERTSETNTSTRLIKLPVCYHESFSFDLARIASEKKISADQVVSTHATLVYRVYMIGFLPGFPYMGRVDERIATPRLEKPRSVVAAGSVGIAGIQTGIYPLDSPGGWNIVGRTPVRIFDVVKKDPALFRPGDRVKFEPISKDEFDNFSQENFLSSI